MEWFPIYIGKGCTLPYGKWNLFVIFDFGFGGWFLVCFWSDSMFIFGEKVTEEVI